MGILDDAIREHLELKRRHGVPEEELLRQEEEALGPARREVAPAEVHDGDGAAEQVAPEAEAPSETEVVESEAVDAPPAAEGEPVAEPPREAAFPETSEVEETQLHEPFADETELHEPSADETDLHEPSTEESALGEPPAPLSAAPLEPKADHPPAEVVDEPAGGDVVPPGPGDTPAEGFDELDDDELHDDSGEPDEDEDDAEPGDADVLEDTPDFLQETPEHDRLWFEQKPPRDFDFD
jgi:hypothetical protein